MRVRTYMRPARGARSISDVVALTGIAKGWISMFERGHALPSAEQAAALEPVYGPVAEWYPAGVLDVLLPDLARCEGCDRELAADSSGRRRYHSDACRSRARRRRLRSAAGVASSALGVPAAPGTTTGAEAPDNRSLNG